MTLNDEKEIEYIRMEADEIDASNKYFEARPQIDGNDRRNVFKAGFERGYKAGKAAAPSQEVEPVGEVTIDGSVNWLDHNQCMVGTKLFTLSPTAEQAAADMKRRCIEVCKSLITSKGPRDELTRAQDQAFQIAADELESLPTSDTAMEEMRRDAERLDWLADNFHSGTHFMDSLDKKMYPNKWMWTFYAPEGVQCDLRKVIDSAIAAEKYQTEPKDTGSGI
jgi:hypothetical protein